MRPEMVGMSPVPFAYGLLNGGSPPAVAKLRRRPAARPKQAARFYQNAKSARPKWCIALFEKPPCSAGKATPSYAPGSAVSTDQQIGRTIGLWLQRPGRVVPELCARTKMRWNIL